MTKSTELQAQPYLQVPLAGLLGWLLPGAGHLLIGERGRGMVFMTVIALTFWGGVAIGGVKNTVNPTDRRLWFLGQICAGSHALVALAWSKQIQADPQTRPELFAYGRAEEVAVVYTAICGMLNLLIILDVLIRAERRLAVPPRRGPPPKGRKGAT